jgi:hypothetical protein
VKNFKVSKMKTNKQKVIAALFVAILVAFIPLGAASPVGISESLTVKAAKSWIGVKTVHEGNSRSALIVLTWYIRYINKSERKK